MIGATPAKFTNSGCTTPSAMPPATPASIALPPASRILKPASAARYWVGRDHVARAHDGRAMALHAFPRESLVAGMEYGASWVRLPNSLAVLFTIRLISPIHEMKIA